MLTVAAAAAGVADTLVIITAVNAAVAVSVDILAAVVWALVILIVYGPYLLDAESSGAALRAFQLVVTAEHLPSCAFQLSRQCSVVLRSVPWHDVTT